MMIALIGESCTGKSTLAERLRAVCDCQVFTGRDYLRLAKNQEEAARLFTQKLADAVHGGHIIYVISEQEHLALLPEGACRVLVTAPLEVIKARFAARTGGKLPPPVAAMLERRHGCFDAVQHHIHVQGGEDMDGLCQAIWAKAAALGEGSL